MTAWTCEPDTTGPCNGDVVVRTGKGTLVALFYLIPGEDGPERTLERAREFCRVFGPSPALEKHP